ncbi:MAG TPA: hypothetical protein VL098_11505 [Flavipsychrobacter sp.]|nr:hypothetical protein [Flavipsychrobacter sp.]
MKNTLMLLGFLLWYMSASAQLSNSQLVKIKEDADDGKTLWIKLFEDSYAKKNMSELPSLRKANEDFLNQNISQLSRLYAEGDGRELVTAVKNYLVIEKQFVKDVMIPAESLKPEDEDGYNTLSRKINEFAQKEKTFEIDVMNAVRTSPEPMNVEPLREDEAEQPELTEEQVKARENAKPRRKEKLPHETYEKKGNKRKGSDEEDAE